MLLEKENSYQSKIVSYEMLGDLSSRLRREGKTLATINGSFDLLHPGHLDMLEAASKQADFLLVLLNSDASIRSYKHPSRPINPLKDRLLLMAALSMVDFVSWFEETDPCAVLEKIRPHVHVNGGDYGEDCIEAPVVQKHGGTIHIVPLVEGYSSTNLINRIRNLCD